MVDLQIVKATTTDIDALAALYDTLNDYLAAHINYPGWRKGIYPTRDEAQHFYDEGTLFAAKISGSLAGSFALSHEPEADPVNGHWLAEARDDEVLVLHVFVVHPDFMRRGIASEMLRFACDYGRANGIKSIRLDVYEKNLAAIQAYEKAGFQYIDTVDIGLSRYGLDWFRLYEKVLCGE